MKTILVPTDFSDCAKYASDTAIEFAKIMGAEVLFYHFMSIPVDWTLLSLADTQKMYPDITRKVKSVQYHLSKLTDESLKHGVSAKSFIGYNETAESIIKRADEMGISMIIMGSHGSKGLKEFFIGSNAQKVVRQSRVPVFILKESLETVQVSNILFVSNFEDEMIQPFEQLTTLAELLGAKINLLYVNTPEAFSETWEIENKMESFIALAGERLEKAETINTRFFEDGIQRYCEANKEGMLAIATHQSKGLSKLFLGGLAEKVVNHIKIPVMSIPIREWSGYPRM